LRVEANRIDVLAAGEGGRELGNQPKAAVIVKQQLHAEALPREAGPKRAASGQHHSVG
jgi:hypothetical protein